MLDGAECRAFLVSKMKLKRLWARCIYDYVGQLCCYTCFSKHPMSSYSRHTNNKATQFFPAIAYGCNVFLQQAHKDDDFGYSVVTAMVTTESARNVHEKPLCYFVFPEHGYAVSLQHLDVLVFNPRHFHCDMEKTVEQDIICLSCYLETSVVGGNDNSVPLTPSQESVAEILGTK